MQYSNKKLFNIEIWTFRINSINKVLLKNCHIWCYLLLKWQNRLSFHTSSCTKRNVSFLASVQYSFEIITEQFAFSRDFFWSNLQKLNNNAFTVWFNSTVHKNKSKILHKTEITHSNLWRSIRNRFFRYKLFKNIISLFKTLLLKSC